MNREYTLAERAALTDLLAESTNPAGYVQRINERQAAFEMLSNVCGGGVEGRARATSQRATAKDRLIVERCAAVLVPIEGTAGSITRNMMNDRLNDLYGREIR